MSVIVFLCDFFKHSSGAMMQKYYIRYLELRGKWLEKHGENASLKALRRTVLDVGPAPFSIVKKYIDVIK